MLSEAKNLGIDATSNEIQQRILSMPYFLENGNFIFNQYEVILRQNGMTVQEFEDRIRLEVIQDKLRNLITDAFSVSDKEADALLALIRGESISIFYVRIPIDFGTVDGDA